MASGTGTETPGVSTVVSPVADISAAEEGSLPAKSGAPTEGAETDPATTSADSIVGKPADVGELGELCHGSNGGKGRADREEEERDRHAGVRNGKTPSSTRVWYACNYNSSTVSPTIEAGLSLNRPIPKSRC